MHVVFLTAFSQEKTITGKVLSSEDGQPLPGVTVVVKGTTRGTITDWDGLYTIDVFNESDVLVFSFVGMESQEFSVAGRNTINVTLSPDVVKLEEVVVTAMGIKREKKALGYSAQEVDGEKIVQSGQQDVSKALQGKIAGVTVKQTSGMPGAASSITIRGGNSLLLGNQPLYVVDGMPLETENLFQGGTGGTDRSSRSLDLNPDDIESINVLKGPAAAALYGLRASNGVIIITTKSGKAAQKAKQKTIVTINSSYTLDKISRLPELQSTYAQGVNDTLDLYSPYSWGPRIDTLQPYKSQLENSASRPYNFPLYGKPSNEPAVYNNMENFFRMGRSFKNSFDISTSSDVGSYSIGLAATNMTGIIPTTGMNKYNAKFNGVFNLHEKIKLGISTNYANERIDKVPSGNTTNNPLFTLYSAPCSYDLANMPYQDSANPYIQKHYRKLMDNPYWALEHNKYYEETQRIFGNINLDYNIVQWLNFNYRIGIDNYVSQNKDMVSIGSGSGRAYPEFGINEPSGGSVNSFYTVFGGINSTALLTANKTINKYRFDLIVGNEFYDKRYRIPEGTANNLLIPGFYNLSASQETRAYESLFWKRGYAYFSSVTADYDGMIYLTPTFRADIVSNMPSGNRMFLYPSVSSGLILKKLSVFENMKVLTFGKVRLSYAMVGQDGNLYSTRNNYVITTLSSGMLSNYYMYPYNGVMAYTANNTLYTMALKPQNTKTIETGAELRFLENRIGIDYTFYVANAEDQIFRVPIAYSTGYSYEYRNSGSMRTIGQEIVLSLDPIKNERFAWNMQTNFTTYETIVKALANGVERIDVGANFTSVGTFAYQNQPYPVIFGTTYLRDDNGNIVVDSRDSIGGIANPYYGMPLQGKQGILAKVAPDFEMSFLNTFSFQSLSFHFQVDWRQGGYMHSGLNALLDAYGMSKNTENRTADYIVEGVKGFINENGDLVVEGTNDIPIKKDKIYYDEVKWNIAEADVYSTTFVRLREIGLTWNIPKKYYQKSFASSMSIYLSARNLWLWTTYPNFDPETSTSTGNAMGGLEFVSLPNTKSLGGGIKLTF